MATKLKWELLSLPQSLKRTHNIQNYNLSEIKTVCAMLGILLIVQKFEYIFLLTETPEVELCNSWEFVSQMEESYLKLLTQY